MAALAITACALLFVPAMAGAATTGAISGTVTAASGGAALKGVEVCAYEVVGEEEACILTSASGEYTISGLAPAEYKVEFWPHREGLNYITQFYNDQPTFGAADSVPVTAGVTAAPINAQLHEGGRIAGTVTDASTHAGVGEIIVCAFESISEEGACVLTATGGQYTIAGLPSGSYEVVFAPNFEEEELPGTYITQYYNDKPTFATANLVPVTAPGGTTSGIDAALAKRPLPKVPTISVPSVIAPPPVPAPVAKPLTCKKGFKKKTVAGKARCVKVHHHRRHRQPHHH
jgi:Carboxypeptidase regulatory-like domain